MAARTVRGEVLEYVPDSDGRRMRLSQRPVLDRFAAISRWTRAPSAPARPPARNAGSKSRALDAYGPDDRVFELDEITGELQFGDGVHGMLLPRGIRHVVAQRYQVATGDAGAVAANQITSLMSSVPFVTKVTNALPASGGHDAMSARRRPRASDRNSCARRDRAVTVADYELQAVAAPGADVSRAHAVGGTHAGLDDARVPGTVSVYLLGAARGRGAAVSQPGQSRCRAGYLSAQRWRRPASKWSRRRRTSTR